MANETFKSELAELNDALRAGTACDWTFKQGTRELRINLATEAMAKRKAMELGWEPFRFWDPRTWSSSYSGTPHQRLKRQVATTIHI